MRFVDKVAVVTGSGQGIGEAYAKALAREGAAVVIAEISETQGARVAHEIEDTGGRALFVHTDVASPDSAQLMAQRSIDAFGGIDYLINNAAIFAGMRRESLLSVDYDYYKRFMEVNMNGALIVTRAGYKHIAAPRGGAIGNQSSPAAYEAGNYYKIAKTGVNAITIGLAKELGPMNIRINAAAPGPTDTLATQTSLPPERLQALLSNLPFRRIGTPDDTVTHC